MSAEAATSPVSRALPLWRDPAAWAKTADIFAVLVALALPWSTTLVGIFVVALLVTMAPALEPESFVRSLKRPICLLPIALFGLALVGTLWSEAPWGARLYAVGPVAKLLMLPLLIYHFERSARGTWVFVAFLVSCTILMAFSWVVASYPQLALKPDAEYGVPVKNYIDQSQEFALCAVALAYPVIRLLGDRRHMAAALLGAIAFGFVLNMVLVTISRTALVTFPITLLVFALLHLKWRNIVVGLCVGLALAAFVLTAIAQTQTKRWSVLEEYRLYRERNIPTSIGLRIEFWKKSLLFLGEAPGIGHGTGSIGGLFKRAAANKRGAEGDVVKNPHNQLLNVAIQWGVIGALILCAMWWRHLLLFRGEGLAAWIGL
ncbi:MAG TPA: O-antigen ligase family protein, partial [Bradyrhizobium sp.]|nr:O-antigen ligase family protein [Bradyrhizobium sp.]